MAKLSLRAAVPEDAEAICRLIQELADYERASSQALLGPEDILRDGFGERPAFSCQVAERESQVIGMAIYYERYSTWTGRSLYLEDLIVTESERGQGAGKMLLQYLIEIGKAGPYKRLEWQVLDWNEPAISFYRSLGAELDSTWINCRMTST